MKNNIKLKLLILRIVGIVLVIAGLTLTILSFTALSWEHCPNPFVMAAGMFSIGPAAFMIVYSFASKIAKANLQLANHIQEENKELLTQMTSTSADIASPAVTKVASAVKEGLEEESMFCKHCGAKIDADSKFCNKCGGEQ